MCVLTVSYVAVNLFVPVVWERNFISTCFVFVSLLALHLPLPLPQPPWPRPLLSLDKISTSLVECECVKAKIEKALCADGLPRVWTKFPPTCGQKGFLS